MAAFTLAWQKTARAGAGAAAFAVAIVLGTGIALSMPRDDPYTATGTVECQSDSPVVGIWVSAPYGDAGWAEFWPEAGRPSKARFYRPIPHGGAYTLNVGCGGTPGDWEKSTSSRSHGDGEAHFTCNDRDSPIESWSKWFPFFDPGGGSGTPHGRCDSSAGGMPVRNGEPYP